MLQLARLSMAMAALAAVSARVSSPTTCNVDLDADVPDPGYSLETEPYLEATRKRPRSTYAPLPELPKRRLSRSPSLHRMLKKTRRL